MWLQRREKDTGFYVPPSFKNVITTNVVASTERRKDYQEHATKELLTGFSPEVIIIADPYGKNGISLLPILVSDPLFKEMYNRIKDFEYYKPARWHTSRYYYAPISIYEKRVSFEKIDPKTLD